MQYTQNEGKIRSELTAFWETIGDVLANPEGQPFEDHRMVRRLNDRCSQAYGLMCSTYQVLMDHNTRSRGRDGEILRKFGLELSLNLLDNRLLLEKATALAKS